MAKLQITLVKSAIGHKPNQIKTLIALGLTRKVQSTVLKDDNDAIRGMISTVAHLVEIKEVK